MMASSSASADEADPKIVLDEIVSILVKTGLVHVREEISPEADINELREVEVNATGSAVAEVRRRTGESEERFHRWRAEGGGFRVDQERRPRQRGRRVDASSRR